MQPRHFWMLYEVMAGQIDAGQNVSKSERKEMLALLEAAEKGEF